MMSLRYGSVLANITVIAVLHLSENKIVLKLSGFRTSDLLFLWSVSYYNKSATTAPGALKRNLERYNVTQQNRAINI